ncbi:adenosine deaminase [Spirulina sp. 06S082]|uniref:adenosine deaminase family protein n=1 Tax=Spirulina sp. 06S082 TaxID=3110248 RepID=UPI002B214C48|nr:adenosine deaminase [Spirulina sp. 06S082]MEA5470961.1 adenosine deaminase [Spirulina sp. 06S082]
MHKPFNLLFFASLLFSLGSNVGSNLTIPKAIAQETTRETTIAQRQTRNNTSERVAAWFESNRDRPTKLRAFLQRMPKGGDIHSHLSGAVYAESYLEWAAEEGYCVNTDTLSTDHLTLIEPQNCDRTLENAIAVEDLQEKRTDIYNAWIDRWSTRNLAFAGESGHDRFFNSFQGFDPISSLLSRRGEMVGRVANRAAAQHIFYLELMLTFQSSEVRNLGREVWDGDFASTRQKLLANGLPQLIEAGQKEAEAIAQGISRALECDTPNPQPGCEVTVRYLQQTTRIKSPAEVFAQFVYAFELVQTEELVVGLNLVAPEDHPLALRDYTLQMEMLQLLNRQYPNINIALHAGELTLGLVPPSDLKNHIRQAVEIAEADRIGHGAGIFYEENPLQLLEEMKRRGVLVEICLTSNDVILGVKGEDHPFPDYLQAGVPVTLASDDEGISRIDLSNEYLRAAQTYNLGYLDLKKLARNSLEYSFIGGDSLWQSPNFSTMIDACADDVPGGTLSRECNEFLQTSDRAREQWRLEVEFTEFENLSWLR